MSQRDLLAQAIDIQQWLERDQATPFAARCRRDRAIGLEQPQADRITLLLHWWSRINPAQDKPSAGTRVAAVRRWLSTALVAGGVVVGATLCSVALSYRGDHPVNLFTLLGVLVGIPTLLLLLTLAGGLLRGSPGAEAREVAARLRANRWVMGLWSRMSGRDLATVFARGRLHGPFVYWQLVLFSQLFAVGYFVGVAGIFAVLVAVTDLAFGWSTTLEVHAVTVEGWVAAIAAPWAGLWPAALPDASLIETSRFFRLEQAVALERAERLGGWWPFVLMTMLVWGLCPRLLLLVFAMWRVSAATRGMFCEQAQVHALLDRLLTPAVDYDGVTGAQEQPAGGALPAPAAVELAGDAALLIWNDAAPAASFSGHSGTALALSTLDSDAQRQQTLQAVPRAAQRLIVVTKGWEPPVLEFNDLLAQMRAELGPQTSIVVAPVNVGGEGLSAEDLQIWSRAVAALGDPRVYVADISGDMP